jgi:hypothetical protein
MKSYSNNVLNKESLDIAIEKLKSEMDAKYEKLNSLIIASTISSLSISVAIIIGLFLN